MGLALRPETVRCLERLEALVDPAHLRGVRELHAACHTYQPIARLPAAVIFPPPDWPSFNFEEIQRDREKMLLAELAQVCAAFLLKDDRLPSIRADYGTGIIASLFGCAVRAFRDNLPVALPFHSTEKVKQFVAAGIPDLRGGLGARVFDMVAFYKQALGPYPKLREWVKIDLADIQGPLDAAEIVWGSEIFVEMYENPGLVHDFLDLMTRTIKAFILAHQEIDGEPFDGQCGIWGGLGRVCVREDVSVALSGAMYDEFAKPYTQRLLDEFGGCIHWCGDAKAWWRSVLGLRRLSAVNPYQGEFYEAVEMHATCRAAGVSIFQWTRPLNAEARARITSGLTLLLSAQDLDSARRLFDQTVEA